MTERELYKYRDAKYNEQRLLERLKELESRQTSVRSPCANASPPEHSGDGTHKLIEDIDRLERLRGKVDAAKRETDLAELRLENARRTLDEEKERKVFDALYFEFLTIEQAAKKIHYSRSSVYQIRRSILAKVANL